MILKAYAKINWALRVCGCREDGYHLLDMLMQRISLCDELRIEASDTLRLEIDGAIPGNPRHNLVLRAANALNEAAGTSFGASVYLNKHIPSQAGLGGGSADCAAALLGLNELWGLGFDADKLLSIGLKLGADVPFCLQNALCRVGGIGEKLSPFPYSPRIPLLLYMPRQGLSTAEVFAALSSAGESIDIEALAEALRQNKLKEAQGLSRNDLELPALRLLPELKDIMTRFRAAGAPFVRMSGSGACVFAAFESVEAADAAARLLPGSMRAETLYEVTSYIRR